MTESTRPAGAPHNGDGGTDGTRGPVPPPSSDGGRPVHAALFEELFRDRRDERFVRQALRHRVDLRLPHGLLLACGPDCDPPRLGRVIAGRIPRAVAVCVADGSPRHAAVVVPVPAGGVWTHALFVGATEAAARAGLVVPRAPVLGLRALRASYFTALGDAALAVALQLDGPLVAERDLVIPRMLAALPAPDQDLLLQPLRAILALPPAHRDPYVRTLEALHHNGGSCPRAAATLHVHTNTVRYRLTRIEDMTGMRLDDPRDRLRLDLAAMLVRLRGHPPDRETRFGQEFRQAPEWLEDREPLAA